MPSAAPSPFLVPYDGSFKVSKASTRPPKGAPGKKKSKEGLKMARRRIAELQHVLYADDRYAVLLIFQALDAAGKDSTIRAVLTGVNPAGCQVFSFKQPSAEELDHDFLWRTTRALPERGRIGVFNRSYYEEVLVARVHPEILASQRLPDVNSKSVWSERLESIRSHEKHLARNGTVIVKFWLNVSAEEQRRRFLSRLDEPHKRWKFSKSDVDEREFRKAYLRAFEKALNATSRPWAPWYAIPADDKPFMRTAVAEIVAGALEGLDIAYPHPVSGEEARLDEMRRILSQDGNA